MSKVTHSSEDDDDLWNDDAPTKKATPESTLELLKRASAEDAESGRTSMQDSTNNSFVNLASRLKNGAMLPAKPVQVRRVRGEASPSRMESDPENEDEVDSPTPKKSKTMLKLTRSAKRQIEELDSEEDMDSEASDEEEEDVDSYETPSDEDEIDLVEDSDKASEKKESPIDLLDENEEDKPAVPATQRAMKKTRRVIMSDSDSDDNNDETEVAVGSSADMTEPVSDLANGTALSISSDSGDDGSITSITKHRKRRGGSESDTDEEAENSSINELIARCESISDRLRQTLTSGAAEETGELLTEETAQKLVANEKLTLKPYQIAGINWLSVLHRQSINAVLADEMGLGKTVQAVAFLRLLFARDGVRGPHLIVSPASTIENWQREIATWLPELRCVSYNGSQNERADLRRRYKAALSKSKQVDIWLTTYTYFERESSKDDRKFFYSLPLNVCIFDEAHAIKNTDSQRYQSLMLIKSKRRVLLSGTPVQNRLDELFALLSFCLPKLFHPDMSKIRERVFGKESDPERVRHILAPFVLRRLKAQVLSQLSPKTEEVIMLDMLPAQVDIYNQVLDDFAKSRPLNDKENVNERSSTKPTARGKRGGSTATSESLFTELRKIANHPLMVKRRFGGPGRNMDLVAREMQLVQYFGPAATMKMISTELEKYSDWDLNRCCLEVSRLKGMTLPDEDLYDSSCKATKLRTLLPDLIANGHRILLFSQWTTVMDILEEVLTELDLVYMRLDGSTAVDTRQSMVDSFNSGVGSVFLLSTRAGGLGINLTSADVVILHDLDFNPTIDSQAMDRCHRIGQQRRVHVIKLVCKGTVDEAIYNIQTRKLGLNRSVLGEGEFSALKHAEATARTVSGVQGESSSDTGEKVGLLPSLNTFDVGIQENDDVDEKKLMDAAVNDALAARVGGKQQM